MNREKYAPVILFAYKRLHHLMKVLKALDNNELAHESILFIFSDGYKDDSDEEAVKQVRKFLDAYKNNSKFKKVIIQKSKKHCGLANSVIHGVTEVINQYGKVIVVEDDLVTSPDFLKFMNDALDYYANDGQVWSIAGYTPAIRGLKKYKKDVYVCPRAGSWGWATWKDRWENVDWYVSDYQTFVKSNRARKAFGKRGGDMPEMLDAQMRGEIDSWAIRFCYAQFKNDMITINPTISRVCNIGHDGSGTHSGKENKWEVVCNQKVDDVEFIPVKCNRALTQAYYDFFVGTKWERLVALAKRHGGKFLRLLRLKR